MTRAEAFSAIHCERELQAALFDHPDGSNMSELIHVNCMAIYLGKLSAAVSGGYHDKYRKRLIQLAALAVQGLEALDQAAAAHEETLVENLRRTEP